MIQNWRNTLAVTLVILFGCILFFVGTDGLRAFTSETARVNQLIKDKPLFPEVTFEDSEGRLYPISEFKGKYVLATFYYTSCTTVCPALEMNMGRVYDSLPSKYIGEDIVFLSISFDPAVDHPAALDKYKDYFDSDGETWRMARIPNQVELDNALDTFGVIVKPDGKGNFEHNPAFYLIDQEGRLLDVMDYTKVEEAADKLVSLLEAKRG